MRAWNARRVAQGGCELTAIEGVQVVPLTRIADERGAVLQMLRSTDPHFRGFGEIYFSTVFPRVVKAWKNHSRITANYACVHGRIKVVLYDDRDDSTTNGGLMEVVIGPDEHALVVIPPGVWHGFQGMGEPLSILANCATEPSDPDELTRRDAHSSELPYGWSDGL
jgi:dTDP-4-dehydrorhamnose 3,5-epimerase